MAKFKAKGIDEVAVKLEEDIVVDEPIVEEVIDPLKEAKVTCKQLNVRKTPSKDADVVCVINDLTPIKVDISVDAGNFYKVVLGRIEGFCMKDFIEVK